MMKKVLLWLLVCSMALVPMLGMVACGDQTPADTNPGENTNDPDTSDDTDDKDPSDPSNDTEKPDLSHLPSVPSDREVSVVQGSALHENTDELGRIPQGLAEVVNKYMTSYEGMNLNGALTTFQTSTYAETQYLPTDAVMAYCSDKAGMESIVKAWDKVSDQYELHLMTIINRTNETQEYLSSDPSHMSQAMKDKNGNYLVHSGTNHYMMPNEEWTEYLWEMVEIALDTADLKTIVFEEPDLWKASGYSTCFKEEWEKYYNEPWQDQTSSPEAMYKSQQLKIYLLNRMMETIITRIKEKSPDTKVYLATHSVLSYNIVGISGITSGVAGITTGTNQYLATGLYDGIIGQTWSDTAGAVLTQNGMTYQNRFLAGYLGYASYVDSVGDLDLFTLADPVGDGIGKNGVTESTYYQHYFDTITAQMLQPTINRYQVVVWPARSFEAASQDYRAVQLSVMAAQTEAAGKQALQSAGTPGISYVLSDTLSYPLNRNTEWAPSSNDSVLGMTLPLLTDGIPLTVTAMENIKSPEDLKGINLLLLSFDGQKPMDESILEAIAEWIEQGGVCLYVGGHDAYDTMDGVWWSASDTPIQALFDILGLDIAVTAAQIDTDMRLEWLGSGKQAALNALNCSAAYNNFYVAFEGDVNAILALDGQTVGIDEEIGQGHLVAVGLPSALFAKTAGGSEAMRKLAEYACGYTEYKYDSTTLMWSKRGNVVAAYSIGQKNVLTGKYIDLFDTRLGVHTHYVLEADDSALLYDVTDLNVTDSPRVAFSGGVLTVKEESPSVTKYNVVSPVSSTVASRIFAPEGLYPQSISATNYKGNIKVECFTAWDSTTNSLLVRFAGMTRGVNVTVEWGTTPVDDYDLQKPVGVSDFIDPLTQSDMNRLASSDKTVLSAMTNLAGNTLDQELIIANTSKADSELYYCDAAREIVWCIDLKLYPDAYFVLMLCQNYQLDVSTDGENWKTIQNFITVNGNRINASANIATFGIDSKIYAKDADKMYVRLSNADPTQGYGGAVSQYQIYYSAPVVPETDPADYAPLASSLAEYDAKYADFNRYSVASNASAADKEYIAHDYAQANDYCRYCDTTKELYLKIDLTKYDDAVVALQIAQNYRVQVSADGRIYTTAQNYLLAGNEWINNASNMTHVILDSALYAPGADALYIKLDNAGNDTQGYGCALYAITIYYSGDVEVKMPTLPKVEVEDYLPLVDDLSEYDAKYAFMHKYTVNTNSYKLDKDWILRDNAKVKENLRYCDGTGELVLKFDLNKVRDAVIALQISQNYRVQLSLDDFTYVTVQDWLLAGHEWSKMTQGNLTYAIINSALYADGSTVLYVKIDNAGADDQGWGGALHSITIYYNGTEIPVPDQEAIEKEIGAYLPVVADDTEQRATLAASHNEAMTVIVNNTYPGSDAEFVVPGKDTDKIDERCKFCDAARSLTYLFDLTKYQDAAVLMQISSNYTLEVSTDGESWTTVQDYVKVSCARINNISNKGWIVFDSSVLAKDADKMYVRLGNCGNAGDYGGAVYQFTLFYNK